MKCPHEGWGQYSNEKGPRPEPTEMEGPCEHQLRCPTCDYAFHIYPCGHEMSAPPMSYRIAVSGPAEVR